MKITVTKVKKELVKKYRLENLDIYSSDNQQVLLDELIKDTIKIIDEVLKKYKGFSIL